jgi:ATP-dependent Lon protease
MTSNAAGDNTESKSKLPMLPIRDLVVYPFMIMPLFVGRESSIQAVEEAINNHDRMIVLASQKDIQTEKPLPEDIYSIGTVAMIMRMRRLPDGRIKILIQGLHKVRILSYDTTAAYYKVDVEKVTPANSEIDKVHVDALTKNVKEKLEKVISFNPNISPDILMVLEDIEDPGRLADLIASNINLKVSEAQSVLELTNPVDRLSLIDSILSRDLNILNMQEKLKAQNPFNNFKAHKDMSNGLFSKNNQEQENTDDDISELKNKLNNKKLPEEAHKETFKQVARLEKMHPDSSEANILRTYIDWIVDLPWNNNKVENLDLKHAKAVLDEDHFDLDLIKERIIEHLAVRKLKGSNAKSPILCFAGPPGVGKTSLGRSIAKATGRDFVRISLGGVKDEAEIRGHRRTYVGAMPGRFIQALKQAKSSNPIILLDEIDKIGSDYKGDPSSALLEVLDPEQNHTFRDHYLGIAYDLSQIMFIATANVLEQVPAPLRDRMEIIHLSGYTQEEKLAITKKFLVPKQMDENGVTDEHIEFTDDGINQVIRGFTREAGLRNLERQIGSLCRKVAKKIALGEGELVTKTTLNSDSIEKLLGPKTYSDDERRHNDEVGVATGLAWTSGGGETLIIETTKMKGKGITLTGKLGDTMKESAQAAMGYIRANSASLGIDEDLFNQYEIHVHLPAGAIPKDGPSAGITLATAIVSLLTKTHISKDIAMTGEITLTGRVLPVGGIKEKSLAAMRTGITDIIIPWGNIKDLSEIPEEFKKKINFIPVKNIREVLEIALVDWEGQAEAEKIDNLEIIKKRKKKKKDSGPGYSSVA